MEQPTTPSFSPRAQLLLKLSRDEAARFQHNYVGTEHLLLGIVKLAQGVAVNVLQKQGVDLEKLGAEMGKEVGLGPTVKEISNPPHTPRFKKVLALAGREAKSFGHTHIGTEHLLLGLLVENEGPVALLLKRHGVELARTREEVLMELSGESEAASKKRWSLRWWELLR